MRIGVSWGRTLADVIRNLRPGSVARLRVAQLSGGVNDPVPGIQGTDIARGLADRYPDSRVYYLHAPAIVASQAIYSAILSDPSVESALSAARRTQVALVGIGQITPAATMYRGGHVDEADWAILVRAGAVGNMNTRFFDAAGRPVPALEDRTVAITWAEMRAIPNVIAVAAGLDKVEAIAGALATGAVDSLVTDERTARALLKRQR